ncbi:MAG: MATE family efflux transporter [Oscillospiraceae bacterium]|nr:MATE family efflux transporter [Oscillospiraceae bacterium]
MKKRIDMLEGPLLGGILRFAFPIILTNLLQILYNTADKIVVGQYCGSLSIAAISATSTLTTLFVNFFIGFSVGTGVCVARALGGHKDEVVHRTVHTALPTAAICGGILSVVGIFFAPTILTWMGTPATVLPLSTLYVRIYFAGMIFNMVYNFSASILRAAGETKLPLYFLSIAGVVNVVLNVFFVTVLNMNVGGVALATAISQALSAILAVIALMRRTDSCRFIPKKMRIYGKQLLAIIRNGMPAGIQNSLFALSNIIITSAINSFNSEALISGHGAAASLEAMNHAVASGFSTTTTNYVGQNAGAHNFKRVKRIYYTCLGCVTPTVMAISLTFFIFGESFLSLFITDSAEAISYGILRLTYMGLPYFLLGLMDCSTAAMRGLGYSLTPMFITLMGACGLRILWVYTIFEKFHTIQSLYISYPISWIITFLVLCIMVHVALSKKMKMQNTLPQRSTI